MLSESLPVGPWGLQVTSTRVWEEAGGKQDRTWESKIDAQYSLLGVTQEMVVDYEFEVSED